MTIPALLSVKMVAQVYRKHVVGFFSLSCLMSVGVREGVEWLGIWHGAPYLGEVAE